MDWNEGFTQQPNVESLQDVVSKYFQQTPIRNEQKPLAINWFNGELAKHKIENKETFIAFIIKSSKETIQSVCCGNIIGRTIFEKVAKEVMLEHAINLHKSERCLFETMDGKRVVFKVFNIPFVTYYPLVLNEERKFFHQIIIENRVDQAAVNLRPGTRESMKELMEKDIKEYVSTGLLKEAKENEETERKFLNRNDYLKTPSYIKMIKLLKKNYEAMCDQKDKVLFVLPRIFEKVAKEVMLEHAINLHKSERCLFEIEKKKVKK